MSTAAPTVPTDSPRHRGFAVACVALVFLAVLAAIVAPVIEDKVAEDRAAEVLHHPRP